ncbi:MAG: ribonuclease HII [Thermoplasmata archaeon]|jgi:ribonuclease HII
MIECGIDEAGRGPVIGPLVICGVCGDPDLLKEIGVKDSKKLSPKRREYLYDEILKIVKSYKCIEIWPEEIDSLREKMNINEIEEKYFSEIINSLEGDVFILDAADVSEERFEEMIRKNLNKDVKIISKHKADSDYPIVSAASIIAKVTRDREIENIKKQIGDFGSGYPSDPRTIKFIRDYIEKNGKYPPFTRKSWKTIKNINKYIEEYGD